MTAKRSLLLLLTVWEIIRLFFLIALFSRLFPGLPLSGGETMIAVMLIGSGQLIVPAGALYLLLSKKDSAPAVLLLGFGKSAGLVAVLLALVTVIARFFGAAAGGTAAGAGNLFLEGTGLFTIFALDLIFLFLLLSFKVESNGG